MSDGQGPVPDPIRVLLAGACGRMGQELTRALRKAPGILLVAAVDPAGAGSDLGELVFGRPSGLVIEAEVAPSIHHHRPHVLIDFTRPEAVMGNVRTALARKVAGVVGTTGLSEANVEEVRQLCAQHATPAIIAPNFALGACLMMRFAAQAAQHYQYAQIIEYHHEKKKDAPSGTAVTTAQAMHAARGGDLTAAEAEVLTVAGALGGEIGGIGLHAVRMPGFVAEQEVLLGGDGEVLRIRHSASSRDCFVQGVLLATRRVLEFDGLIYGLEQLL